MTAPAPEPEHLAVGAYALGLLESVDAARFEEHLAGCERCGDELEELLALHPLLAEAAEEGWPVTADGPPHSARPAVPDVPSDLVVAVDREASTTGRAARDGRPDEVAAARRHRRRRTRMLLAAALVLIVGGPMVIGSLSHGESRPPVVGTPSLATLYEQGERVSHVDPETGVNAGVSMHVQTWGTDVILKLSNVEGPEECGLYAVGRDGTEQTITTWSVPEGGYDVADRGADRKDHDPRADHEHGSGYGEDDHGGPGGETGERGGSAGEDHDNPWKDAPYYARGVTAFTREDIDHFEVRTLNGELLVRVPL